MTTTTTRNKIGDGTSATPAGLTRVRRQNLTHDLVFFFFRIVLYNNITIIIICVTQPPPTTATREGDATPEFRGVFARKRRKYVYSEKTNKKYKFNTHARVFFQCDYTESYLCAGPLHNHCESDNGSNLNLSARL